MVLEIRSGEAGMSFGYVDSSGEGLFTNLPTYLSVGWAQCSGVGSVPAHCLDSGLHAGIQRG